MDNRSYFNFHGRDVVTPQESGILISLLLTYRLPLLCRFLLSLHLKTLMDLTILVGEEPTVGISQFKVPMILKILELNPSKEIERPCGVGKDHI